MALEKINIAVITPGKKEDYLVRTIVDGLESLREKGEVSVFYTEHNPKHYGIQNFELKESDFITYAKNTAHVILYCWGKKHDYSRLVYDINRFDITAYIDGSELGHNIRLEPDILNRLNTMKYTGQGAINAEMLKKCKLYFRREKPYIQGILPLPYGIERTYIPKNMIPLRDRKYDIFCVFGQRMYPPLREEIYNFLKRTYASNLLWNKSTALPFFGGHNIFSRYRFYKKMSESKLGISVSGGGYDTARFWEILGGGALLVTQKIDIDFPQGVSLPNTHVFQFTSIDDFTSTLDTALHTAYNISCDEYQKNYEEICRNHSSEARIRYVLRAMGL